MISNKLISQFDELRTTERDIQISLNGALGLSDLRDEQQTANSGAITDEDSEFRIRHTASNDFARLQSQQRADYRPGFDLEAGVGIRLDKDTLSNDAVAKWGFFDMGSSNPQQIQDGLIFGLDKDGQFIQIIKNGTEKKKIYNGNWNIANPTIDLKQGNVFQVDFTYYGYGIIKFSILKFLEFGSNVKSQRVRDLHIERLDNETSLKRPNLKVGGLVSSSNSSDDYSIFMSGRQVSVVGNDRKIQRLNSERVTGNSVGTSLEPVISFQKKQAFNQVDVKMNDVIVLSGGDALLQIRVNSSLTGASFSDLSEQPAAETAVQADTSASSIDTSTGVKVFETLIDGSGNKNKGELSGININNVGIPDDATISLVMKSLTGSSITIDCVATVEEGF